MPAAGTLHHVLDAFEVLMVRREQRDDHVGQMDRADAADVGDTCPTVDKDKVVLAGPLCAQFLEDVAEAMLDEYLVPIDRPQARDIVPIIASCGDDVDSF